jgi:hypothetical protein
MIICEWSDSETIDMGKPGFPFPITPQERAAQMIHRCLRVVNDAGLDGKRLDNLEIRSGWSPEKNDIVHELHAVVTHRLASQQPKP